MHESEKATASEKKKQEWSALEVLKQQVIEGKEQVNEEDRWIFNIDCKEAMRKSDEYVEKWKETMEVSLEMGRVGKKQMRLECFWK